MISYDWIYTEGSFEKTSFINFVLEVYFLSFYKIYLFLMCDWNKNYERYLLSCYKIENIFQYAEF